MKVDLLGVAIDAISKDELVDTLASWAVGDSKRRAYYVHAHALNLAYEDPVFRASLNEADLVYCDGFGAKIAASLTRQHIPERMTPPDWIDALLRRFVADRVSLFLVGDESGVAEACAGAFRSNHAGLVVAGAHHGFFDLGSPEDVELVRSVNESGADVVLVGMGMPRQEAWIDENLDDLNVRLCLPVGALFRWYAGVDRRPPNWVTSYGLEWLGRLVRHPVRHFRRYVVGLPLLLWRTVRFGGQP
jgi:N-acetylglucosaminyldiphosphoundecaprenol N-acetyl-beta-D-mannosaminyltransferase